MAPRKGKGRQAVRNGSKGFPGWGYAAIGLIAGAILMALVLRGNLFTSMGKSDGPQANPQATAERGSAPGVLESSTTDAPAKKPQFDFYSVLSEKEVRIPDAEISAQARVEQEQKQQQAAQQAAQAAQAVAPANLPPAVTRDITAAPANTVTQSGGGSGYLLQVGAFPTAAAADSQKAKLALQGFVANVQTVNVDGQTYHRVRLGPFPSATALEATKQKLATAGIPAIALKEGK